MNKERFTISMRVAAEWWSEPACDFETGSAAEREKVTRQVLDLDAIQATMTARGVAEWDMDISDIVVKLTVVCEPRVLSSIVAGLVYQGTLRPNLPNGGRVLEPQIQVQDASGKPLRTGLEKVHAREFREIAQMERNASLAMEVGESELETRTVTLTQAAWDVLEMWAEEWVECDGPGGFEEDIDLPDSVSMQVQLALEAFAQAKAEDMEDYADKLERK